MIDLVALPQTTDIPPFLDTRLVLLAVIKLNTRCVLTGIRFVNVF